jgi:hypothetical protein
MDVKMNDFSKAVPVSSVLPTLLNGSAITGDT